MDQTLREAPGPKGPFVLRARGALGDPNAFLAKLVATYGDVVRLRLAGHTAFVLGSPELVQFVLVDEHGLFRKTSLAPATHRLLGNALFVSEEPEHMRDRRVLQPMFRHDKLGRFIDTAVRLTNRAVDAWAGGGEHDAYAAMSELSSRIALAGAVSVEGGPEYEQLKGAVDGALEAYQSTLNPLAALAEKLPTARARRVEESTAKLEALVDAHVAARLASPGSKGDILDLMSQLKYEDGQPFTPMQLRQEALDVIVGANNVLGLALTWALYELAHHPQEQAKVVEQTDEVLGGREPRLEDAHSLVAARAAFQEALRLHPPAWAFMRQAKASTSIGGFAVPKGALLILSPHLLQRDARFWPDPARFDLRRWAKEERGGRPKLAYFPFGAGPRACLGEPLATAEGTVILGLLLRRFTFEPAGPEPVKEWAMGLHPSGRVPLRISPRPGGK